MFRVPVTGIFKVDVALAFMLFCFGLWFSLKYNERWPWLLVAAAGYWGYLIYRSF